MELRKTLFRLRTQESTRSKDQFPDDRDINRSGIEEIQRKHPSNAIKETKILSLNLEANYQTNFFDLSLIVLVN